MKTLVLSVLLPCLYCIQNLSAQPTNPYLKARTQTSEREQTLERAVTDLVVRGRYREAEHLLESNRAQLEQRRGDDLFTAYALFGMAKVYATLNRYGKAETCVLRCLKIRGDLLGEQHPDYFGACLFVGELYTEMGRLEEARLYIDRAKNISGATDSVFVYKVLLLDIEGEFLAKTDRPEAAEENFLKALAIKEQAYGKRHPAYVDALVKLARLYLIMGRLEESERLLSQALGTGRDLQKVDSYSFQDMLIYNVGTLDEDLREALFGLVRLYAERGERERARDLCLSALQSMERGMGKRQVLYANLLSVLGRLQSEAGQPLQGLNTQIQAHRLITSLVPESNPHSIQILLELARAEQAAGQSPRAEQRFERLLGLAQEHCAHLPLRQAIIFDAAGVFYAQTGRTERAAALHLQALKANAGDTSAVQEPELWLERSAGLSFADYAQALRSLQHLFDLYEQSSQNAQDTAALHTAYALLKNVLSFNERVRNRFMGEDDQLPLLAATAHYAHKGITLALRLGQGQARDRYAAEALALAEQNKSVLLSNALKADKAKQLSNLPPDLVRAEDELRSRWDAAKKQLLACENPELQSIVRQELIELEVRIHAFRKDLENRYPEYYARRYQSTAFSLPDLQKQLAPGMLLLEYFVHPEGIFLFAADHQRIDIYPLEVSFDALRERIKALRRCLSDYEQLRTQPDAAFEQYTQQARWFYTKLLEPALSHRAQAEHLILVADGALGHLPFEVFLTQDLAAGQNTYSQLPYLLRRYKITYSYGAQIWLENLQASASGGPSRGLLFAAAATYDERDSLGLQTLPAAQEEVRVLSQNYRGLFLQDTAAGKEAFKSQAPQYDLIHLAMHGLLNVQNPLLSALAFTHRAGDKQEDRLLEAWEIAHLRLNARLAVLSACETGYGKFRQGEGIMSLARAFMYAGIPALVVSLWEVNDGSTALIMEYFYQNLADGADKAQALRQAKLSYLQQAKGISAHPAYWSAFVQMGDSAPLYLQRRSNGLWWWLSGAAVAGLAAVWLRRRRAKR